MEELTGVQLNLSIAYTRQSGADSEWVRGVGREKGFPSKSPLTKNFIFMGNLYIVDNFEIPSLP